MDGPVTSAWGATPCGIGTGAGSGGAGAGGAGSEAGTGLLSADGADLLGGEARPSPNLTNFSGSTRPSRDCAAGLNIEHMFV